MNWKLIKNKRKIKIKKREINFNILEIELDNNTIKVFSQDIIDKYLINIINKDLNDLLNKIYHFLIEDDNNSEGATIFLDQLARQRSVFREYDKKMSKKVIAEYMMKMRTASFELKKHQKSYDIRKTKIARKSR